MAGMANGLFPLSPLSTVEKGTAENTAGASAGRAAVVSCHEISRITCHSSPQQQQQQQQKKKQ